MELNGITLFYLDVSIQESHSLESCLYKEIILLLGYTVSIRRVDGITLKFGLSRWNMLRK